jgi:hypothetical protein
MTGHGAGVAKAEVDEDVTVDVLNARASGFRGV